MRLPNLFNQSAARLFEPGAADLIVEAIRAAEIRTSGEVRVYVESKCRYIHAMDRAAELFFGLRMDETANRNAVLVYVAMRDHQFAIFADEGIFREMGAAYWNAEAAKMLTAFKANSHADAIITVVNDIGNALAEKFPYDNIGDRNELPDEIIFGK